MPKVQNQVRLTAAERAQLEEVISKGHASARAIRRAHSLLLAQQGKTDQAIGVFLGVNPNTVSATRQRYREMGLPAALHDKARPGGRVKLDGKAEAFVIALACSDAPDGRVQWTMQLLADRLVELKVIDQPISDETVRRHLKKVKPSRG